MVDMALAAKFNLDDKTEQDMYIWQISQYILSVGKALGAKYPSRLTKPPKSRLERLRDDIKGSNIEIPNTVLEEEELMKRWNIKLI